jgi:hypothetical protein
MTSTRLAPSLRRLAKPISATATSTLSIRPNASEWSDAGGPRPGAREPFGAAGCRRAVIDRVGGFDLNYRLTAGYDFMLRALELGDFNVAQVGKVLVDMADGGLTWAALAGAGAAQSGSLGRPPQLAGRWSGGLRAFRPAAGQGLAVRTCRFLRPAGSP